MMRFTKLLPIFKVIRVTVLADCLHFLAGNEVHVLVINLIIEIQFTKLLNKLSDIKRKPKYQTNHKRQNEQRGAKYFIANSHEESIEIVRKCTRNYDNYLNKVLQSYCT